MGGDARAVQGSVRLVASTRARPASHSPLGPNAAKIADGKAALARYPVDHLDRVFDHTGQPGVVPSPWPDRFGHVGIMAIGLFQVDDRAPHQFMWHQHPRQIRTGSTSPSLKAPLGYIAAYWLARHHGYVTPAE